METWKMNQVMYDEWEKISRKIGHTDLFNELQEIFYDWDNTNEYILLGEFMYGNDPKENSENQLTFAKAWSGEIGIEVEKKRYVLKQWTANGGIRYVSIDNEFIGWTYFKDNATRFTKYDYPLYKNTFMRVEEVN